MNVRGFAVAALLGAPLVSVCACNNGPIGGDVSPVAASGNCSDPNPSPMTLTFAGALGRAGADGCVYQDLSDDGWPLQPGATFTFPGPICFNLAPGEQPTQLVRQGGDVSVPVSSG
jgi:hypothetical protein